MESKPTMAKLIKSLDHPYVRDKAEYLILLIDNGTYEQNIVLPKPFAEKVGKMTQQYDSELKLYKNPCMRITKACYTTKKGLPDTLSKLLPSLQN